METNALNIYQKLFEVKKAWIKLQRDTTAFNYKYATLSQIQEKLNPEFIKQNLLIFHYISEQWHVITRIHDIDAEDQKGYIESWIPLSEWTKPQDKWSEITYYRRYNLLSLLDLEVEDDDWKKAQDSSKWENSKENDDLPWIADENLDKLDDLLADWKTFTYNDIKAKYKISKANRAKLEAMWIK